MEDPREGISLPESRIQPGSKHPRDLDISSISTSITETEFPPNKKVCPGPDTEKGKEPYSAIEFQQYTHSHHNSYCSDPLRALYIDKGARLKYEDQEAGFNWEIPLWREDDDKYSEITFAHLGVQGNNPLMVKFEIGVEQDEEQEIQWSFRDNLDDNKIPKLYNNSPEQTPIRFPSDNPKIVVVEGKKLETQNTPKIRDPRYPNLSIKPVKQIKSNSAINKKITLLLMS
ncbi:hypothetical protein [Candidatus Odyssella thessalonicensis]|uniref:hypothetical protein n=1 Tax=Candidatus Odyssella thessalonicensis TaxID=84647 RepID=UPI000225ACC4|nr:hypothetical protein [Candidatus Odyssella thessalonicensis]